MKEIEKGVASRVSWDCASCEAPLGAIADGRLRVRVRRGREYVFSGGRVTAICGACGAINEMDAPAQLKDARVQPSVGRINLRGKLVLAPQTDDRFPDYHGNVADQDDTFLLIQWWSWADGRDYSMSVVTWEDTMTWKFYGDRDEFDSACSCVLERTKKPPPSVGKVEDLF